MLSLGNVDSEETARLPRPKAGIDVAPRKQVLGRRSSAMGSIVGNDNPPVVLQRRN